MLQLDFAAEYSMEGDTLTGVAHSFGEVGYRNGMLHRFTPESFGKSKPIMYYHHDLTKPMGIPTTEIKDGKLHFSVALAHQSYTEDFRQNYAQGTMRRMSFGVTPGKWEDTRERGRIIRTHTQADFFDLSPVVVPAMDGTTALLHSGDVRRIEAARARFRVLEGMTHG